MNNESPASVHFLRLCSANQGYWFSAKQLRHCKLKEGDFGLIFLSDPYAYLKCGLPKLQLKITTKLNQSAKGYGFAKTQQRNEATSWNAYEVPPFMLREKSLISDGSPLLDV